MKKVLFYIFSIIIVIGCADAGKKRYTISGTIPGHDYDNEWIYLVPFKGTTAKTVDSIQIKDGSFTFKGVVDTPDIRILRIRHILKPKIQELLVVVEQGSLNVSLDSVSSAHGTPQNDILQQWKEEKIKTDSKIFSLSKQMIAASAQTVMDSIEHEQAQIRELFNEYNYNMVKASGFNAVGSFIYDISEHSFTTEQKYTLDKLKN